MRFAPIVARAAALLVLLGSTTATAAETTLPSTETAGDLSGVRDFDFLMGEWRVRHRILRPLKGGSWSEFEGHCSERPLMDGRGNVEEHRFERPSGVTWGVAVRSYDPKTAEWAIWWIDSRVPHGAMDPPMKGRFEGGVGTFYSDSTLDGKPIQVRFVWIANDGRPHWEQAYSEDGGATWAVNWIMEFEPAAPLPRAPTPGQQ
ncbi:MAG: DUF1579 domain-containing protein [Gemmatimonadales bacterium]